MPGEAAAEGMPAEYDGGRRDSGVIGSFKYWIMGFLFSRDVWSARR
jgi:hypothetical protein